MRFPTPTATHGRLVLVAYAVMAASFLALFAMSIASPAGGQPAALDFTPYWAAARLAIAGHARDAYDNGIIEAFERAHTRLSATGYLAFYYPPPFLLLCLPLGLLPYLGALAVFLAAQAALLWVVLRRILAAEWARLAIAAYPGFLMNAFSGQNAGFTACCFGGALLLLEARPLLAGACLGALVCKPQMALAVPVALIAARRWRAVAGAAASAAGLCLLSWLALGPGPWRGFLANAPAARGDLEHLAGKWPMMQSFYAQLRLAGAPLAGGYLGQAAMAVAALSILAWLSWRRAGAPAEMAALSVTALLVTPFLYDYDLGVAAPGLAWLAAATAGGALRGERAVLVILYCLPIVAVLCGRLAGITLAPPLLLLLLLAIARRATNHQAAVTVPA